MPLSEATKQLWIKCAETYRTPKEMFIEAYAASLRDTFGDWPNVRKSQESFVASISQMEQEAMAVCFAAGMDRIKFNNGRTKARKACFNMKE